MDDQTIKTLLEKAKQKHGKIKKLKGYKTWKDSINEFGLWYNTPDGSTHIIRL